MIKMPLPILHIAAFCIPLALVTSCGTESAQNTTLTFDPSSIGQRTTPTTGNNLSQSLLTIQLRSPTGYAQINTDVIVDMPSGGSLYLVDTSTTPFTFTPVDYPLLTTTNSNGVATVAIDFAGPVAANGTVTAIEAFSGTAYSRVDVTYTCEDDDTTDTAECPT